MVDVRHLVYRQRSPSHWGPPLYAPFSLYNWLAALVGDPGLRVSTKDVLFVDNVSSPAREAQNFTNAYMFVVVFTASMHWNEKAEDSRDVLKLHYRKSGCISSVGADTHLTRRTYPLVVGSSSSSVSCTSMPDLGCTMGGPVLDLSKSCNAKVWSLSQFPPSKRTAAYPSLTLWTIPMNSWNEFSGLMTFAFIPGSSMGTPCGSFFILGASMSFSLRSASLSSLFCSSTSFLKFHSPASPPAQPPATFSKNPTLSLLGYLLGLSLMIFPLPM
mmetsp:Transcript_70/g.195  ORF Transcript_70/g.195 Transcript_70/m.195 type:complete len:272 (+) Transcript_70:558-1373(+)